MAPASSVPTAITDETTQSAVISNQLPPGVICVTCLAYMNLYCKVDDKSGRWTCALCQSENVTTVETVVNHGRNLLVSPRIEFRQALTIPIIATEKNADVTPSSSSREQPKLQSTIVVVLDQNLPSQEAQAVGNMMKSLLEKETKENHRQINNLGLIIFGKSVSIYQLGISSSGMAVADTFRSHEGFTVDRLKERSYLGTSVETLLTCISAQFGISAKHATGSDGKETHAEPIKSRMEILKERKQARLQKEEQRQKSADANDVLHDDSSSSGVLPRSPWTVARERSATSKPPFRCTGEAIQCAIDLASMADLSSSSAESSSRVARAASRNDRILLFTNGCPNLGNGSVVDINDGDIGKGGVAAYSTVDPGKLARASEYYDLIAKAAAESGIGMDVFCTGSAELGLPAYQSLVEPSSGYVLSHDSFTTPHLEHNVGFIVQQTHISMAQFFEESQDDKFVASPEQHLLSHHGTWVDGCMVDIRMSRFVGSLVETNRTDCLINHCANH